MRVINRHVMAKEAYSNYIGYYNLDKPRDHWTAQDIY